LDLNRKKKQWKRCLPVKKKAKSVLSKERQRGSFCQNLISPSLNRGYPLRKKGGEKTCEEKRGEVFFSQTTLALPHRKGKRGVGKFENAPHNRKVAGKKSRTERAPDLFGKKKKVSPEKESGGAKSPFRDPKGDESLRREKKKKRTEMGETYFYYDGEKETVLEKGKQISKRRGGGRELSEGEKKKRKRKIGGRKKMMQLVKRKGRGNETLLSQKEPSRKGSGAYSAVKKRGKILFRNVKKGKEKQIREGATCNGEVYRSKREKNNRKGVLLTERPSWEKENSIGRKEGKVEEAPPQKKKKKEVMQSNFGRG